MICGTYDKYLRGMPQTLGCKALAFGEGTRVGLALSWNDDPSGVGVGMGDAFGVY